MQLVAPPVDVLPDAVALAVVLLADVSLVDVLLDPPVPEVVSDEQACAASNEATAAISAKALLFMVFLGEKA